MPSGPPGAFVSAPLTMGDAALFTDLYELTMAAAFFREGVQRKRHLQPVRAPAAARARLPRGRGPGGRARVPARLPVLPRRAGLPPLAGPVRAGVPGAPRDLALHRRRCGRCARARCSSPRSRCWRSPAPLIEAQLLETAVINFCHVQTLLASKAARVVLAANGRALAEFGLRRSHGTDAGMKAARCAFLAGFDSTSNVLAGRTYGVPLSGTMAHSFVTAFPREIDAFLAYARAFPDSAVLLLDTYDTAAAARQAVEVARGARRGRPPARGRAAGQRRPGGAEPRGSGDPRRRRLPGCPDHRERRAGRARRRGAARRGRADRRLRVGTRLDVSADAPSLEMVYKLVSSRRARHAQAEPGQGDLGRREAGRPPARRGWAAGGRHAGARVGGRARGGGAAARAGDAGRTADRAAPGARDAARALRAPARRAAGGGAAAAGPGGVSGGAERGRSGRGRRRRGPPATHLG